MSWKWYGVKTAFRTIASGDPISKDADFDNDATLVEERIVLVRARTFDHAIAKGESEARKYATRKHRNSYRQTVRTRFLEAIDAFELFDEPAAGVEVFSTTEIISRAVADDVVIDQYFGALETDATRRSRRKFFNSELPRVGE